MKKISTTLAVICLASSTLISSAYANTVTVSGNIYQTLEGSTFDTWYINMLNSGDFTVNILAFESTTNSADDAIDINGDGEFTYLDPDTYFYKNTGNPLKSEDYLARCDDINNHCDTIDTPSLKLSSLSLAEGATDGSIHFRRDPAFNVTLGAGSFLYLIGDYRLKSSEAESGINGDDKIRNTLLGGHADYQITLSSDTMKFDVSGNNINVSAVPLPAAIWLFSSGIMGLFARKKLTA